MFIFFWFTYLFVIIIVCSLTFLWYAKWIIIPLVLLYVLFRLVVAFPWILIIVAALIIFGIIGYFVD